VDEASEQRRSSKSSRLSPETLEGVRRRDPEALSELFEACFDRIYSLAYRLLGERLAAEDVSQEVFLRVYRAADRIDPARDPGPWLATITHNVCRDHWRSRPHRLSHRTRSLDAAEDLGDSLADPSESPEAMRIRSEKEQVLLDALMRLPESLRAVVILHDYHGMDLEEVARAVGSKHAAIRKRHSRALAALRKELDGLWP
jgi:RNA polymerase sigma-70 factor (ECF subfamily)